MVKTKHPSDRFSRRLIGEKKVGQKKKQSSKEIRIKRELIKDQESQDELKQTIASGDNLIRND